MGNDLSSDYPKNPHIKTKVINNNLNIHENNKNVILKKNQINQEKKEMEKFRLEEEMQIKIKNSPQKEDNKNKKPPFKEEEKKVYL